MNFYILIDRGKGNGQKYMKEKIGEKNTYRKSKEKVKSEREFLP